MTWFVSDVVSNSIWWVISSIIVWLLSTVGLIFLRVRRKWIVRGSKALLHYFIASLMWLRSRFPYRMYNKNKFKLTSTQQKDVTHYIKLYRNSHNWIIWVLQDTNHIPIRHSKHKVDFQTPIEAIWNVRTIADFVIIDKRNDRNSMTWWCSIHVTKLH